MIEPAAYGAAVSFGPNTRNFRDIVAALLAAEAAVVVNDANELESFVRRCLEEPSYATLAWQSRPIAGSVATGRDASHCRTARMRCLRRRARSFATARSREQMRVANLAAHVPTPLTSIDGRLCLHGVLVIVQMLRAVAEFAVALRAVAELRLGRHHRSSVRRRGSRAIIRAIGAVRPRLAARALETASGDGPASCSRTMSRPKNSR